MIMVEVRDARIEDRSRCLALLDVLMSGAGGASDAAVGSVFDQFLDKSRGQILVASEGDTILGMACFSYGIALRYGGEYCILEELVVDPAGRGKNIGGMLLQRAIDAAKARGCADFGVYLVEATEHNLPFYEKYGFERVGSELRQPLRD
jgi:glucosamine-phosphate N-acetyltransferase